MSSDCMCLFNFVLPPVSAATEQLRVTCTEPGVHNVHLTCPLNCVNIYIAVQGSHVHSAKHPQCSANLSLKSC